jgi:hypothetical protein
MLRLPLQSRFCRILQRHHQMAPIMRDSWQPVLQTKPEMRVIPHGTRTTISKKTTPNIDKIRVGLKRDIIQAISDVQSIELLGPVCSEISTVAQVHSVPYTRVKGHDVCHVLFVMFFRQAPTPPRQSPPTRKLGDRT